MFLKNNLITTIVTAIWAFMGGYLLWGILGDSFLNEHLGAGASKNMANGEPNFAMLALGCLIMAWAFTTIYSKWAGDTHGISQGVQYGLLVGILFGFGSGIIDHATANMLDMTGTLVNGIIYIVFYVIMGILASLVYGKLSK